MVDEKDKAELVTLAQELAVLAQRLAELLKKMASEE
jgi:hypothetical protein